MSEGQAGPVSPTAEGLYRPDWPQTHSVAKTDVELLSVCVVIHVCVCMYTGMHMQRPEVDVCCPS